MDSERFDSVAKVLAVRISRRGATAVLPSLAAITLAQPEAAEARRKKKKKKKGARCMTLRESCNNAGCCGSLGCGDNGCDGGNVCFQGQGGSCSGDCDCGGDLRCSERQGDTCQDCSYPETPCTFTSECCLRDSICGYNGCTLETTCCQWEIGSFCYDDCDCCEELGCFGNACLPLLLADGSTRRKRTTDKAAEAPPAKGSWPRRDLAAPARQAK